mgnify:CR=1 FL=1|tara:strand:- start:693 stop:1229 length:537 start_codon:yes stop_codon:yes gene_type:complete
MLSVVKKISNKIFKSLVSNECYARRQGVEIGFNCRLYIKSWGSEPYLIKIGDEVTIASGVRLLTHDGATCLVKNNSGQRYYKYGRINIGDRVFVGMNAIIMPGVTIGNNVIVGAGSIVTKDVPSNSVIGGNPAKIIISYSDYEEKTKESFTTITDLNINKEEKVKQFISIIEGKVDNG